MNIFKCLRGYRLVLFSLAACTVVFVLAVYPSPKKQHWTCCKNNKVTVSSRSSRIVLPLQLSPAQLAFNDLDVQGTTWKIAALDAPSVGEFMGELPNYAPCPMIAVVRDRQEGEYVIIYGKDRQLSLSSMKHYIDRSLLEEKNEKLVKVLLSEGYVCITVRD